MAGAWISRDCEAAGDEGGVTGAAEEGSLWVMVDS